MSARRLTRCAMTVVAAAVALTGCAIRADSAPRDVPDERNQVFGEPARGDVAAGTNRIFLLAPTDPDSPTGLRTVLRDVAPTAPAILASLFAGPNGDEREDQIDTAIPNDVELVAQRRVGEVITIDVNDVFDDLTPEALRLAVAQIVATATEIDGIDAVQLRIDGEPRVWPLGNGQLTDRALTVFDYPGLVESSQPAFPAIPPARS